MTDTPRETILAGIRNRLAKATPTNHPLLKLSRYEHGGGRLFIDGESGARELIADFYSEGDREFYSRARADIEWLLAECDTLRAQLAAETWRCFHCGEVFATRGGAQDHFGRDESAEPGCLIDRVALETGGTAERGRGLLMALRKAEDEIAALRLENEKLENDSRLWYESEADRVRRIGRIQWWQELDSREGERLVLRKRAEQAEAQLAAREGEIATLKEKKDELTRRVTMAEQQPRSAASTNETALSAQVADLVAAVTVSLAQLRHAYVQVHDGRVSRRGQQQFAVGLLAPEIRRLERAISAVLSDQPPSSDARPTESETGTATGSATKCLSCAAAEARADTAEAQLRAQERNDK